MKKATVKTRYKLSFFIFFGWAILAPKASQAFDSNIITRISPDSIGNEVINGNRFVIHRLASKETYYQLGRIYAVPVKDIMEANNKKNLRAGDTVKIPRGKAAVAPKVDTQKEIVTPVQNPPVAATNQNIFTEYKVGKNETLYAISRRFSVSVDDIKKTNNLKSNNVREGQILKIPDDSVPQQVVAEEVPQQVPNVVEEHQPIDDSDFRSNRYGIREKKERGIGAWMESLGNGQASLALHKTAPIGTILKITNPMNKSVTFAKVVGKFGDNEETHDAIVVLSKSVVTALGLLDRRFLIELNYGVPLE